MNRQQAIIASALVLSLASAGTTAWSLRQQAGLQTKVDQMSTQVDSAVSDAAQARRTAAEGENAIVDLHENLGGEISRVSAELDELVPDPLRNGDDLARQRDVDDVRNDLDLLISKYRDLCTNLLINTDLVVRC